MYQQNYKTILFMKRLFRTGFSVALATLFLVSCSSSDDNSNNGGNGGDGGNNGNETELKGTYKKGDKLVLDGSKTYNLVGKLVIEDGATLTIPAGTKIIGTGGTSAYIAIGQGGKIFVEGTKDNPVVMTGLEKKRGSWGGLVLCGKAPINKGTSATAEVSDLTYGGADAADNSGSIRYLRIEYAGANFNSEKEFNGLSFFGVGSGTVVEYVQAHEGSDDGFEWFGGTVNTKYLVSTHNDDDQFDWTEGWTGNNEFWYSKQSGTHDKGFEADNNSKNRTATPIANPTIKNITLVAASKGEGTALKLREGTRGQFENLVLDGWKTAFDVEHDETINNVNDGSLFAKNVKFVDITTKSVGHLTNPNAEKDEKGEEVNVSSVFQEGDNNGAGNGSEAPEWTKGWTVGL